jgi:hypothetical protein
VLSHHLSARSLLLITALFWLYVTLSNVMYARSMQVNMARFTQAMVFASWGERVLQHLILYPLLFGCYWGSLRLGWQPTLRIAVQIALAVGFAAVSSSAMDAASYIYYGYLVPAPSAEAIAQLWVFTGALWLTYFTTFLLAYGFGLALVTGAAIYRRFHAAELRVSWLEREWSAARLSALRMQLSPHTLFNLLHTIRGQINWDPQVAQKMVVQLGDLLRGLLSAGKCDVCPLSDELRFVQLYLELQQQRFSDRLRIILPDINSQPAVWLPSLVLQPLVENAVIHGLANHDGPVEVRVEALVSADTLILRVVNTITPDRAVGREGIGLSNVRERLRVQFGSKAEVSSGPSDRATWVAQVQLPALSEASTHRTESGGTGVKWTS